MKIIAVINKSVGNEKVGDMWIETKSFDDKEPLYILYDWIKERSCNVLCTNIKLSVSQE